MAASRAPSNLVVQALFSSAAAAGANNALQLAVLRSMSHTVFQTLAAISSLWNMCQPQLVSGIDDGCHSASQKLQGASVGTAILYVSLAHPRGLTLTHRVLFHLASCMNCSNAQAQLFVYLAQVLLH
jgi:hypothetical protein